MKLYFNIDMIFVLAIIGLDVNWLKLIKFTIGVHLHWGGSRGKLEGKASVETFDCVIINI